MTEARLKIGIDVDGTLYHWTKAVNKAVEEKFGVTGLTEHTHWNYLQDNLTADQWRWVWSKEAAGAVFGRRDMAFAGSRRAVNSLCNTHEVHFVTHRNPRVCTAITGEWLASRYFGYAGVHVLYHSVSKVGLRDWDLFIDDKPETITEFENAGIRILVPARPWNEGFGEQFADWRTVPELIQMALI